MMMVTAPSEGRLEEGVLPSKIGHDRTRDVHKRSTLGKLRARLRVPFLVDLFIIITVGLLISFVEFGVIPNTNQGFICKDPKISHPFKGDTVTITFLLTTSYFGPILIITLVEALKESFSLKKVCLGTIWKYYKECLIGATFVLLITEVIKAIMGEPRPHFLDSCEPDANRNCTAGTFISEYKCTNTRLSNFFRSDITKSFPSGHTSVSLFIALYCSYLVQIRIPSKSVSSLTKPFLIAVCLTWSLFCSLSRITDGRHHWWDVLGGAFLGLGGAFYSLMILHHKEVKQRTRNRQLTRSSTTMSTLSDLKAKDSPSNVI